MDNAAGDPPCADPSALQRALDRLNALISWERADRLRMQVDLTPIIDLLARLGNPHRRFRSVHVTGTKGKGSVCALVEAGLGIAGWRVGRYASPHVQHINERISIDRRPIEDERLAEALMAALAASLHGGRWIDVVLDGAHVDFAVAAVLRELRMQHDLQARPVVLLALGAAKNANAFAAALAGEASIVVCTQVQAGRPGMDLSVLADAVRQVGLATQNASDPLPGFKRCCELADAGWILVTGSFYLVSAIREELAALS